MGSYVAFDFETANSNRASACAIGAVRVEDGRIVDRLERLIDPEAPFDGMNVSIHGITPAEVAGAPTFPQVYADLVSLTDGADALVGHSAAFDVQVLRGSANRYGVAVTGIPFACTRVFSRRWWPGCASYSLTYVLQRLEDGPIDGHHQALWDAEAVVRIAQAGMTENDVASWTDAAEAAGIHLGAVQGSDYAGCSSLGGGAHNPIRPHAADLDERDESHPLFGVTVSFTGALSHYTRRDAAQRVADAGGSFAAGVSGKTQLLVVGAQDLSRLAGHDSSS